MTDAYKGPTGEAVDVGADIETPDTEDTRQPGCCGSASDHLDKHVCEAWVLRVMNFLIIGVGAAILALAFMANSESGPASQRLPSHSLLDAPRVNAGCCCCCCELPPKHTHTHTHPSSWRR